MEIDNAVSQDLGSFGKRRFFKMALEKIWIFVWEILNILKLILYQSVTLNTVYAMIFHFIICNL